MTYNRVRFPGESHWRPLSFRFSPSSSSGLTIDNVIYDQFGAPFREDYAVRPQFSSWGRHEGVLGGVDTSLDWYHGARPGPLPNRTDNPGYEGVNYTYHNIWGQVVVGRSTPERRVRVQCSLPKLYHLAQGSSRWVQVRGTPSDMKDFDGGYCSGTTLSRVMPMSFQSRFRNEADGHSFDTLPMTNFNGTPSTNSIARWFYSGLFPRVWIPVGTQIAIFAKMRLITDVSGVDVNNAEFYGAFSGDLYTGPEANDGAGGRHPALAVTRHKRITSEWKPFTYVSGTEAQIRAYPTLPFIGT